MSRAAWFGNEPEIIVAIRKRIALAKRQRLASVDGRRMAETGTGSVRSTTSAVAATSGETPDTPSHSEAPDNG